VPERQEYLEARSTEGNGNLLEDLHWQQVDYNDFKESAIREVKNDMINYNRTPKESMKALYQQN